MNLPRGKGYFIWIASRCEGGEPARIAEMAARAGLSHILIKIAHGIYNYNISVDLPAIIAALRSVGVEPWGWHYVLGDNPVGEADRAIRRMIELELTGYVINAEKEYKNRPAAALTFMQRLRSGLPGATVGLSSYRYPSVHPEFPWFQFRSNIDFDMPQIYWMFATNSAQQLQRSYDEFISMSPMLPYLPTGAAFTEHGWVPMATEVVQFLDRAVDMGVPAVNFWEWYNTRAYLPALWDVISSYPWPAEEPAPAPEPPVGQALVMSVVASALNVRSGPGIGYPIVGSLSASDQVIVQDIAAPTEAWVQHESGNLPTGWSAAKYGGKTYLERA